MAFRAIGPLDNIQPIQINSRQQVLYKMNDEILTPKELMELLDINSPTTLINYEKQGRIVPHRPLGRKKYYLKSEVMRLFKRRGRA